MTVYLAPREASPPSQSWELSEVAEGGGRARGRPLRRGEARRGCRQGRSMLSPRIRQARRGESSGGAGPHRETSPGGRGEGAAAAEAPGNKRWVGGRGLAPRWSAVPEGIEALDSDLGLGGVSAPLWGLLMLRLSCRNSCWRLAAGVAGSPAAPRSSGLLERAAPPGRDASAGESHLVGAAGEDKGRKGGKPALGLQQLLRAVLQPCS